MNGDTDEIGAGGSLVYCRLCAELTDSAVNIFNSEEAVDKALNMNLYEKLVTYFPIIISKVTIYMFTLFDWVIVHAHTQVTIPSGIKHI